MPICLPSFAGVAQPASGGAFVNDYSISLDGTDDFISIPASTDFDLGTGAFTYSMWFNLSDYGPIAGGGKYGGLIYRALNHRVKFQNDNKIINFSTPGGELQIVNAASSLLDAWHHIAIVRDTSDNTIKCYLDAGTPTSNSMSASVDFSSAGNDILLGRQATNWPLEGLMDEFSILDSALSASQVSDIYNSGVPIDIESLNPVGWWRMGDGTEAGSGTTIYDMSDNSNNATLTNGPTFSTTVPVFNRYSLSFDASDDFVTMSNPADLNFSGDTTISFWVKYTNQASSFNFVIDKSTGAYERQYALYLRNETGGTKTFSFATSGGAAVINNSTGTISVNQWSHVAVVVDSGVTNGTKLYINGSSETLGTHTITTNNSAPFQLGKRYDTSFTFGGLMDEVAIFNSALSASDVSDIYNSGVPNDLSALSPLGWWRMGDINGASGVTITDQGSGGNNGTLTNGPTYSTSVPS